MSAALAPSHLLLLDHTLGDHLIDRGLNKTGADPLLVPMSLTIVWNEPLIVLYGVTSRNGNFTTLRILFFSVLEYSSDRGSRNPELLSDIFRLHPGLC